MFNPKQLELILKTHTRGTLLNLYVQPKASKSEVWGVYGSNQDLRLKVRVAAPPIDGEANSEVCRFFAKLLDLPKSKVILLSGDRSRYKVILVLGTTRELLIKTLIACLPV